MSLNNNTTTVPSSSSSSTTSPATTNKASTTTALSPVATLSSFLILYFTTLFSLDAWAAARNSPYRSPISSNIAPSRPAVPGPPAPDSYQGRMHGRGNAGPREETRRPPGGVDSRPPLKMGGSSACGACSM